MKDKMSTLILARINKLEHALYQLINGVMLDEYNHDDNSLTMIASRSPDLYTQKQLEVLNDIAVAALKSDPPHAHN